MKLKLVIIILCVLSFVAGLFITKGFADESPTRTYYNNKVPYKAFFSSHDTNLINIQIGNQQKSIPVINDSEKDLTQKEEKKGQ